MKIETSAEERHLTIFCQLRAAMTFSGACIVGIVHSFQLTAWSPALKLRLNTAWKMEKTFSLPSAKFHVPALYL
jgi:hypothetical protein